MFFTLVLPFRYAGHRILFSRRILTSLPPISCANLSRTTLSIHGGRVHNHVSGRLWEHCNHLGNNRIHPTARTDAERSVRKYVRIMWVSGEGITYSFSPSRRAFLKYSDRRPRAVKPKPCPIHQYGAIPEQSPVSAVLGASVSLYVTRLIAVTDPKVFRNSCRVCSPDPVFTHIIRT